MQVASSSQGAVQTPYPYDQAPHLSSLSCLPRPLTPLLTVDHSFPLPSFSYLSSLLNIQTYTDTRTRRGYIENQLSPIRMMT